MRFTSPTQPTDRQTKGRTAEDEARHYLQSQGLTLLMQNFRSNHGEIDLIMQDNHDIVFVEVRSRGRTDYGNALESITPTKINKIIHTAKYFLSLNEWTHTISSRFDVIAIHPIDGKTTLEWFKNAFMPKKW